MNVLDLLQSIEAGGKLADYEYSIGNVKKWTEIDDNLCWASSQHGFHIRKKQKTMLCNGWEIPAPENTAPPQDTAYFHPALDSNDFYDSYYWKNDSYDLRFLNRNLLFLTKDHAIMCAKAMCGIDPYKE